MRKISGRRWGDSLEELVSQVGQGIVPMCWEERRLGSKLEEIEGGQCKLSIKSLLISYQEGAFGYQSTVDLISPASYQPTVDIGESELIVDKICNLTNVYR
jgi:hypothetical protein